MFENNKFAKKHTDEFISDLIHLHTEEKLSYAKLAVRFGTTKGAIAGIIHRAKKEPPIPKYEKPKQRLRFPPQWEEFLAMKDSQCRYILSHDKELLHFCSALKSPGSSYCKVHSGICFAPVYERRR